MFAYFTSMLLGLVLTGCVTGSGKQEYKPAEVIDSLGGQSTPEWMDAASPMYEEAGNVFFISTVTMAGNSRAEACIKASDLQSRSDMLRHVKDNITSSGQVNEVSAADDPGYESLTAFLSQGSIQGARIDQKFWEKIEVSDADTGERILKVRCGVKLAVKKSELSRQLREATKKQGGNEQVRQALINAQEKFLNSLGSQEEPAH